MKQLRIKQSEGHPSVPVYSGPNSQSHIVGEIASGTWAQGSGIIRGLFVSIAQPVEGWIGEENVECIGGYLLLHQAEDFSLVRVSAKPKEDADEVGTIPSGEWVACMGEHGDFARVSFDSKNVVGWVGLKHVRLRSLEVPTAFGPLDLEPSAPSEVLAQPAARKTKDVHGLSDAADAADEEASTSSPHPDGENSGFDPVLPALPAPRPTQKRSQSARRLQSAAGQILVRVVPTKKQKQASWTADHHERGGRLARRFGFGHVLSGVLQLKQKQSEEQEAEPMPETGRRAISSSWQLDGSDDEEIDWPEIVRFRTKSLLCILVQQCFVSGFALLIDLSPMVQQSFWEASSRSWQESSSSNYGSSTLAILGSVLLFCLLLLVCLRYHFPLGYLLCAAYTIMLTLLCGFGRSLFLIAAGGYGYSAEDFCPWHLTLGTFPVPLLMLLVAGRFQIPLVAAGLGVVALWNASLSIALSCSSCATTLLVPVLIGMNFTSACNILWISVVVVWLGQEDDYFQPMFVGGGIAGTLFSLLDFAFAIFLMLDYACCRRDREQRSVLHHF
eukprot:TRINITY_DN88985_c0_g1_i1.p1 TRINITY_DN88985_c0_g1~~TRINITY_DN88985_c0_g1_i1.p1  ORF type:complete len:557 (-),score=69.45 TRINITY_DN88985_c0_g1_i1:4-1674(-)